jgi:tetratricopeptide (TPR) repeat protein
MKFYIIVLFFCFSIHLSADENIIVDFFSSENIEDKDISKKKELAYKLIQQNQFTDAYDIVDELIVYYEDGDDYINLGYYNYQMSNIYAGIYDFSKSIEYNLKASELLKSDKQYYFMSQIALADSYYNYDKFDESIDILNQLNTFNEYKTPKIYNLLGLNYERLEQYDTANEYYNKGLTLESSDDLIKNKARNLMFMGNYTNARIYLNKLKLKLNDLNSEEVFKYHLYSGELYLKSNKLLKAKEELQKCLNIKDVNPYKRMEAYSFLISTLDRIGDKSASVKYSDKRTLLFHSIIESRNKSVVEFAEKVNKADKEKLIALHEYEELVSYIIFSIIILVTLIALFFAIKHYRNKNNILSENIHEKELIQTATNTIVEDKLRNIVQDLTIEFVTDPDLSDKEELHEKFDSLITELNSIKSINLN